MRTSRETPPSAGVALRRLRGGAVPADPGVRPMDTSDPADQRTVVLATHGRTIEEYVTHCAIYLDAMHEVRY